MINFFGGGLIMNVMITFMIALLDIATVTGIFVMWDNFENHLILYLLACILIIYLNVRYYMLVKSKEEK